MLLLITYDVNTEDKEGAKRLRHISKECLKYGQRVQKSVFECNIGSADYVKLKANLLKIVDLENDSIRFYNLGDNFHSKIEHYGKNTSFEADSILIL